MDIVHCAVIGTLFLSIHSVFDRQDNLRYVIETATAAAETLRRPLQPKCYHFFRLIIFSSVHWSRRLKLHSMDIAAFQHTLLLLNAALIRQSPANSSSREIAAVCLLAVPAFYRVSTDGHFHVIATLTFTH